MSEESGFHNNLSLQFSIKIESVNRIKGFFCFKKIFSVSLTAEEKF